MCRKFRCDQRFSPYPRPVALVQKPPEDSPSPAPLALPHSPSTTTLYSAPPSVALTPQPPLLQILMSAEQCQVSNSAQFARVWCFPFANFITGNPTNPADFTRLKLSDPGHCLDEVCTLFRIYTLCFFFFFWRGAEEPFYNP